MLTFSVSMTLLFPFPLFNLHQPVPTRKGMSSHRRNASLGELQPPEDMAQSRGYQHEQEYASLSSHLDRSYEPPQIDLDGPAPSLPLTWDICADAMEPRGMSGTGNPLTTATPHTPARLNEGSSRFSQMVNLLAGCSGTETNRPVWLDQVGC